MEIDTSDTPPITQKHYTLPLKHAIWVQKELEILEKSRSNGKECIPLG